MPDLPFHPIIQEWFTERFGSPTDPQRRGWPSIQRGTHTLIAAPTGSGKTLAAFLVCLDRLVRQAIAGKLKPGTKVLYVSPLKALSNDIHRNLVGPLAEIQERAIAAGILFEPITVAVRTGDTDPKHRQAMVRRPPHILVTTPESLFILLTSSKAREMLTTVETVIVDEIHAIANSKRGSHLMLSLERLSVLCKRPPLRIGLSATQRPIELIADYLVGAPAADELLPPQCAIIDGGHVRELDLAVESPPTPLGAVCSHEQWAEIYTRLCELVDTHRSTLIFVNTRRLAERVTYNLTERLGEDAVASHHGSMSREMRLDAEERLKAGKLKAIVATASLELGIDIGYVDLVCQIASPRAIATFLQRVGRSGHSIGALPKGRLFPLTRDDLVECLAMVRAVRARRLDTIIIPEGPTDILAQQIIAASANDEWQEEELYALCRKAWPWRNLTRAAFDDVIDMLARGVNPATKTGAYLYHDTINGRIKGRRHARIAAITAGGAIPDTGDFRVITEGDGSFVGTVNEDFAIEASAGDIFLLGNTSWQVLFVRNSEVTVREVPGATPTIPFWFGEAPGRSIELSDEVGRLRSDMVVRLAEPVDLANRDDDDARQTARRCREAACAIWLEAECGADPWAAKQSVDYVGSQLAAVGMVPTCTRLMVERFFDETGGMQLVIHSPWGSRINRAWGLALRKRFCRGFNFELQASADENGLVLSLGLTHSFELNAVAKMLPPGIAQELLEQALLATPIFVGRWRWNATRALAVLRFRNGQRVPPNLQRFRADDLLTSVFPEATACLEHIHGDIELPDHPLVNQTMHDALQEALDCAGLLKMLARLASGEITMETRDTREPSPFSHELVNANVYAFLDPAPLEERRARALSTRRTLDPGAVQDLARLDPAAISQVRAEAWPLVRDADELHDALLSFVVLPADEGASWRTHYDELVRTKRATTLVRTDGGPDMWCVAEALAQGRALFPDATLRPKLTLPPDHPALQPHPGAKEITDLTARVETVRGRLSACGPQTATEIAEALGMDRDSVFASLEALEGEGFALRGQFTPPEDGPLAAAAAPFTLPDAVSPAVVGGPAGAGEGTEASDLATSPTLEVEWCERRLLARIHRLTMEGLRRQIKPVNREAYLQFVLARQHVLPDTQSTGRDGLVAVLRQLQAYECPAGLWETDILPARVGVYETAWLDELAMVGTLTWGRLRPPSKAASEPGGHAMPMNRAAPLAFAVREDLDWVLPARDPALASSLLGHPKTAYEALVSRGAMFFDDLKRHTRMLPEQLENALAELMGMGLITADTFSAVRTLVNPRRRSMPAAHRQRQKQVAIRLGGRWSLFPGFEPEPPDGWLERWVHLLLARYGVIFRDLLIRESNAPPWRALVPALRRLEARGVVRGGRFVEGVGGEQFADPGAVEALRKRRDAAPDERLVLLSAADPANLSWLLAPDEPRLPAVRGNAIALKAGKTLAVKQGDEITFMPTATLSLEEQDRIRRLLRLNAMHRPAPVSAAGSTAAPAPAADEDVPVDVAAGDD